MNTIIGYTQGLTSLITKCKNKKRSPLMGSHQKLKKKIRMCKKKGKLILF